MTNQRKTSKPAALAAPYGKIKAAHRGEGMTDFSIGLPGDLHSNTTKLVLDFANVMGQKLRASELKHGYEDEWKQDVEGGGFESDDVLRECMFTHMLKGDPVDVANFAAFAAYHGVSTRPMDTEEAEIWISQIRKEFAMASVTGVVVRDADAAREQIKRLQEQFDLLDEAAMYRDLIEKMEERHGEDFNAFMNALIMRFLMTTGLPSVTFSLTDLLQQVAGRDATGHYIDIIEAPGKLTYVLRQEGDQLHTDLHGNVESIKGERHESDN